MGVIHSPTLIPRVVPCDYVVLDRAVANTQRTAVKAVVAADDVVLDRGGGAVTADSASRAILSFAIAKPASKYTP